MNFILLTLFVFVINIPFGYWRANVRRFSLQFILAIHLPVMFIVLFRILTGTGLEYQTLFVTVPTFFLGQLMRSKIYSSRKLREAVPLTSCLVMDLVRVKDTPKD